MSCFLRPLTRWRDAFGDGAFKARRDGGSRLHMGKDICAWPGQELVAWTFGLVYMREARPYADDPRFSGVLLQLGDKREVKILYVAPREGLAPGTLLQPGEVIGRAQDLRTKYLGITPHVHIELLQGDERIDPGSYIAEMMS